MAKIEAAIALARSSVGTLAKMTALIGEVERKMANSAAAMAAKKPIGDDARRQSTANGTLTAVDSAHTRRLARARSWPGHRSPSCPPTNVAKRPATTRIKPNQ